MASRGLLLAFTLLALGLGAWLFLVGPRPTQGSEAMGPRGTPAASPAKIAAELASGSGPTDGARGANGSEEAPRSRASVLSDAALAGRSLETRVVDALGGQPVSGALAVLEGQGQRTEARSDSDGRVRLTWPEGLSGDLTLSHPEYDSLRMPAFDQRPPVQFGLQRRGRITGEVRWGGSGSTEGILVEAWRTEGRQIRGDAVQSTHADAAGHFELGGLETDEYAVGASLQDPERGASPLTLSAGILVRSGEERRVRLELAPGCYLDVEVTQSGRGALADVSVIAEPQIQGIDPGERFERRALTDGFGRVRLMGLPEGVAILRVTGPLGTYDERQVPVDATGRLERFELPAQASLSGRVLLRDGQPVAGAWVGLASQERGDSLDFARVGGGDSGAPGERALTTRTDGAGGFRFAAVPSGTELWLVAFTADPADAGPKDPFPGTLLVQELRPGQDLQDLVITLFGALSIQGRVTLSDQSPAVGAKVQARHQQNGAWQQAESVLTDGEGRFRIERVRDLQVRLQADLEGYQRTTQWIQDPSSESVYELVLEAEAILHGTVVDPDGLAIEGARLLLSQNRDRMRESSDEFGRFSFENPKSGEQRLSASAPGFEDRTLDLILPSSEPLVLVLEPKQQPPKGTLLGEVLAGWSNDPVPGLSLGGVGAIAFEQKGGRFWATGVNTGTLRPSITAPGRERLSLDAIDLAPGGTLDLGTLRLFPEAVLLLDILGPFRNRNPRARLEPLSQSLGGVGSQRPPVEARRRGRMSITTGQAVWDLVVEAEGAEPLRQRVELNQDFTRLAVELKAAK